MKTKLLRIIRANFEVTYDNRFDNSYWVLSSSKLSVIVGNDDTFNLIVKMLEHIYPQGRHYAIMRHSRRFKQVRRKEAVRVIEIACVVGFVALIIIAILNSCCGSGIQY
jgi:hypothetical protein